MSDEVGHEAIIGMTKSGKTYLARAKAAAHKSRGHGVLVLDPWRNPDWPCDWMTDSLPRFLAKAKKSRRCALIVEEVGGFGRDPEFAWLFTQARHWGHVTYYLSQYHTQVPPIVRSNCERLSLFKVSAKSAADWAEDFAQPEISRMVATLPRHFFVQTSRYGAPRVCKLNG